jgi:hypothetical protein
MWNYIPNVATVILAMLQLAKDWGAHQTTWRRATVLCLIVLLGAGGGINTYYSSKKASALRAEDQRNASKQHSEDRQQIAGLQKAVEAANAAQESDTKQFLLSFSSLLQKVGDLQSQVKTAGLQKEAAQLRAELESTQRSLAPQKAELESTLAEPKDTLEGLGVKGVFARRAPDGTITFTVYVVDNSLVQAKNGSIFLRICEACMFSEEPARFTRPVGAEAYDREMIFQAISARAAIAVPLRVQPPALAHQFTVAVTMRCENCVVRDAEFLHIDY